MLIHNYAPDVCVVGEYIYFCARYEHANEKDLSESKGTDFIIAEAMKNDDTPLYIALQGILRILQ